MGDRYTDLEEGDLRKQLTRIQRGHELLLGLLGTFRKVSNWGTVRLMIRIQMYLYPPYSYFLISYNSDVGFEDLECVQTQQ